VIPALAVVAQVGSQDAAEKLANATASGIALGAIYALLALGLVLIYKATQVLNFAHGAIAALGAFFAAYLATIVNFPGRYVTFLPTAIQWVLSAIVAVLITAAVGLIVERLAIRPMIGEPLFSVVMITIALDIVLRTITDDLIGSSPRPLGDPWGADVVNIGPAIVAKTEIVTLVVTIVTLIGIALFFRSRYGIAMRATAFDQEAAMAQGISAGRIFAMAWAIGAGLAAIAGIFSSMFPRASIGVSGATAFFAFRALPAVVIGGLDSVTGAVLGGFIVGLAESYAGVYLTGATWSFLGLGFAGVMPYIVMLVVLLVRPSGLFGTEEIRRV
jgi:branched-chain amino acid transport system permease protein